MNNVPTKKCGKTFGSKAKAEAAYGMAKAIEHGFKPTGAAGTGAIKRAAAKRARKGGKKR